MFYDFAITVTKDDTAADPKWQTMKLTKGVVHRVEVQFPIGTRAKVHCQIYHGGHQFLPTNPDGNFASDGWTIVMDEHYELKTAPYTLKAKCWSEADTYSYDVNVRIGVLSKEVLSPLTGLGAMLSKFFKLIGLGG